MEVFGQPLPIDRQRGYRYSYGQATCQNLAIATGCPIVLLPRFHANEVIKAIHTHRITMFSGVPMMYSMITEHPDAKRYDLRSLRVCLSGASSLPADVQERFESLTGARISEGYGLTKPVPRPTVTRCRGNIRRARWGFPSPIPRRGWWTQTLDWRTVEWRNG